MTTHLLIKAIGLQVRALAMMDCNATDRSVDRAPQWDFDDFEDLQNQIEQLAVEAEEHVGPDAVSLTTQMSIAAQDGAQAALERLKEDKLIKEVVPFEQLVEGFRYVGFALANDYFAELESTNEGTSLMTNSRIQYVTVKITHVNHVAITPYSKTMTYKAFCDEFRMRME